MATQKPNTSVTNKVEEETFSLRVCRNYENGPAAKKLKTDSCTKITDFFQKSEQFFPRSSVAQNAFFDKRIDTERSDDLSEVRSKQSSRKAMSDVGNYGFKMFCEHPFTFNFSKSIASHFKRNNSLSFMQKSGFNNASCSNLRKANCTKTKICNFEPSAGCSYPGQQSFGPTLNDQKEDYFPTKIDTRTLQLARSKNIVTTSFTNLKTHKTTERQISNPSLPNKNDGMQKFDSKNQKEENGYSDFRKCNSHSAVLTNLTFSNFTKENYSKDTTNYSSSQGLPIKSTSQPSRNQKENDFPVKTNRNFSQPIKSSNSLESLSFSCLKTGETTKEKTSSNLLLNKNSVVQNLFLPNNQKGENTVSEFDKSNLHSCTPTNNSRNLIFANSTQVSNSASTTSCSCSQEFSNVKFLSSPSNNESKNNVSSKIETTVSQPTRSSNIVNNFLFLNLKTPEIAQQKILSLNETAGVQAFCSISNQEEKNYDETKHSIIQHTSLINNQNISQYVPMDKKESNSSQDIFSNSDDTLENKEVVSSDKFLPRRNQFCTSYVDLPGNAFLF